MGVSEGRKTHFAQGQSGHDETRQEIETIGTAIGAGKSRASACERTRTGTAKGVRAKTTKGIFEGGTGEVEEIVQATFGMPGADCVGFGCLGNVRAFLAFNDGRTCRCEETGQADFDRQGW